jgi:mannose-6-phosphate isomerase-like protein (cupin superfamily)
MPNSFRRIVTGHDEQGRSILLSDTPPPRVIETGKDSATLHEVWNTRQTPAAIDRNSGEPAEERLTLAPPSGGTRIRVVDIPPDTQEILKLDSDAAREHFALMNAETASTHRRGNAHPFMHRTESIDYGIVLEGQIHLILDREEVEVGPGDIVIQRGTNHAWSNRSSKTCRIAFVLIDGKFVDGLS